MPSKRYESQGTAARARRDKKPIQIVIPRELVEWADGEAKRQGTDRSRVIADCVRSYMNQFQGF